MKAPDDQQKYSQANGMVRKCADLIRYRMKLKEEDIHPIRRSDADVQSGVELNREQGSRLAKSPSQRRKSLRAWGRHSSLAVAGSSEWTVGPLNSFSVL